MLTATRSGTCRWTNDAKLAFSCGGAATLRIETASGVDLYIVTVADGIYTMRNVDTDAVYCVDTTFGPRPQDRSCACPDAKYRAGRSGCKHNRGLTAALQSL